MRTKRLSFDVSKHRGSILGLSFGLVLLDLAWAQAANQPAGDLVLQGSFSAQGSCHGSSMDVTISDDISLTLTTYVRYEVYLDKYNHLNVGKQLTANSSASVSGGGTESTANASTSWTYSLTPDFTTTNAWGAVNLDFVQGRGTAWVGASKLPTLMYTDDSGQTWPNPSSGAPTALVQASDQIPYPEITFPTNGTAWTRTISSATNVVLDLMTPPPQGSATYTATVQYFPLGVPQWEAVIQPNPEGSGLPPYEKWLPVGGTSEDKPGSGLAVRAFVRGKLDPNAIPPLAHYKFELSDVSREPGVCMNYPRHSQTPSEGDTPAPFDLQIAPGDSVIVSADGQHAETVGVIQESGVGILCYDYGAYGKLKVTAETMAGQVLVAYVDGHNDQYFLSIPQDENQNHVADAWEKDMAVFDRNLAAEWEGTLDPGCSGQALEGDGISLYEKYRGFFVLLDTGIQLDQPYVPLDQLHQRLDPKLKYLFVYNPDNLVRETFQSADGMPENYPGASSCQVRYVASSGWTGPGAFKDKKRVVNFNYTKDKHVVDQHALYVTVNPSKNPSEPSELIKLVNRLGTARVAKPVERVTEGCTYLDVSAPIAFQDHKRPASTFQVEIYAANVTNYLFDCVKYHSDPECSDPCEDAKLTALAAAYVQSNANGFRTKYTIELSATIAHEMGHGTGVHHHDPEDSDPEDADLANCTMRYYGPDEFPINLNDRFELDVKARGHNPSFFCRKTFNCWGQLQVTDNPDATKGASPAALDAVAGARQAGLMAAHTAAAAHLQGAARASNPLDDEVLGLALSADLDWAELVAGDPLRLWVRLHGITSLVASNWIDGLQMNLYRVTDSGPRELVLGPDRWPGFLQPLWFDTTVLRATNVTRLREWLVAPEVASLNAGKYALEIAWNGSPLAPPSLLPTNGIVSAPTIEFEVQAATNAVLQALNHRHLAWYHYLTDDSAGVLEHTREADRLDPDTLDPLAIQTRLMQATAAVAQGAPLEAAEVLDGLRRRLSVGNCHAAEVASGRFSLLAPSLRMVEPPSANLPVRLEIIGLPGNTYVLQNSADLRGWTSISTNAPTTNRFEVLDSSGTAGGRRYYRVLWSH